MDSTLWVVTHCFSEVSIYQETQQSANWDYVVLTSLNVRVASRTERVTRYFNCNSLTGKLDS